MRLPQDRILHIDTELAGDEVRVVAEWQDELVRCKYCRRRHEEGDYYWCRLHNRSVDGEDYCSWAERRE